MVSKDAAEFKCCLRAMQFKHIAVPGLSLIRVLIQIEIVYNWTFMPQAVVFGENNNFASQRPG